MNNHIPFSSAASYHVEQLRCRVSLSLVDNYASMDRLSDRHSATKSWSSILTRELSSHRGSQNSRPSRSPEARRSAARSHTGSRPSGSRSHCEIPPPPGFHAQRSPEGRAIFPPHRERSEPPRSSRHGDRSDRLRRDVEPLSEPVGRQIVNAARGRSLSPAGRLATTSAIAVTRG